MGDVGDIGDFLFYFPTRAVFDWREEYDNNDS
jgi:hypothetical protein